MWLHVGDPGNAADAHEACGDTGTEYCGAVAYRFEVAETEVTVAQYVEFLNAVAGADVAQDLYDFDYTIANLIDRTGSSPNFICSAGVGSFPGRPIGSINYFRAARFANWMHNGKPTTGVMDASTTEDGAYTITPGSPPSARNVDAFVFLPNEHEWYKAAYYDTDTGVYFDYPNGTDGIVNGVPPGGPTTANCSNATLFAVGSYTTAISPNGTFDQAGNVLEWTESGSLDQRRMWGGGASGIDCAAASASTGAASTQVGYSDGVRGFRLARAFRPPTAVPGLSIFALLGLAIVLMVGGAALLSPRRSRAVVTD